MVLEYDLEEGAGRQGWRSATGREMRMGNEPIREYHRSLPPLLPSSTTPIRPMLPSSTTPMSMPT